MYDVLLRLLSETDGAGQTVSFGYDPVGRATTEIAALDCRVQTTATMVYDLDGNLLSHTTGIAATNAHVETVSFAYDPVNRATQVIEAYGTGVRRAATMIYDLAGNLLCPRRASPPRTRWC